MKVELCNILKKYRDRVVLNIENLEFESGKIYAVLGPNGSGKTTMLRLIAAIEKTDHGAVYYDGKSSFPYDDVAYTPQKPYIFDTTVLGNIILGMNTGNYSLKKAAREDAQYALESLNMKNFAHARAISLSGGEAQKIALLRVLILDKKLALLDEPTAAIDIPSQKLVEDYMTGVTRNNKATLIFSTHNPSQAARIADEVVILWEGRVVEKGPCDKILYSSQQKETKDFLEYWAHPGA